MNYQFFRSLNDLEKEITERGLSKSKKQIVEMAKPYYNITINNNGTSFTFLNINLDMLVKLNADYVVKMFLINDWYEYGIYDKVMFDEFNFLVTALSKSKITLTAIYE